MASYNGLVAGVTSITLLGGTSQHVAPVVAAVPAKFFSSGQFAINVAGISGTIGVQVIGAVGGATFAIAGRTTISASGSFPVPLIKYVGTSGTNEIFGIPRPSAVVFQPTGQTATWGFTASVFFAGEYN